MASNFWLAWQNYSTSGTGAVTAGKIFGVTGSRFEVLEVVATGAGRANPADIQHECWFSFLSNATTGTCTVDVMRKKDQSSILCSLAAHIEFTAEPTTYATSNDTLFGFNQRGGMRWAVPEGYGFKSDGGQSNLSAGVRFFSSSAGQVDGNMQFISNP